MQLNIAVIVHSPSTTFAATLAHTVHLGSALVVPAYRRFYPNGQYTDYKSIYEGTLTLTWGVGLFDMPLSVLSLWPHVP